MEFPLIDRGLAEEFFPANDDADRANLRAMVAEFEADAAPRFADLLGRCTEPDDSAHVARRGLHGLRGVVANFALQRAAERLRSLENQWTTLPAVNRTQALEAAQAEIREGLAVLRERYPYLASQSG